MSILRSGLNHSWPLMRRTDGPPQDVDRRSGDRADGALASQRREAVADAVKRAAHAAYFLGGGRYL